ncbi:unnamed protein product [Rotaria sp. Silwood2]|nr:unnamed protein product [Rotaria sp. Silwood2]CAF4322606.1 unnamed protein product [Rotaria sp. Silwood2]
MEHRNAFSVGIRNRFPSLSVVQLLLSCQAPINAIDNNHYTPLHNFACNKFEKLTKEEWNDIKKIFDLIIDSGAHLDAIAQEKHQKIVLNMKILKAFFEYIQISSV